MTEPQTLAEVRVGDLVWRFRTGLAPSQAVVEKVLTRHFRVGGQKYWIYDGRRESFSSFRDDNIDLIDVGPTAEARKIAIIRENKIRRAARALGHEPQDLNRALIARFRAACDAAERVLDEVEKSNG